MVYQFLCDFDLEIQSIIIYTCSQPLEDAYAQDLKVRTMQEQQIWAAKRADLRHHSFYVALSCLKVMHDDKFLHRLGMAPPTHTEVAGDAFSQHLESEQRTLTQIFQFCCQLASNCVWSHSHFYWSLPHAIALYLLPKKEDRARGIAHLEELIHSVLEAEEAVDPSAELQHCLEDLSWNREQLPRILMGHIVASGFDPDCPDMRSFVASLYAGPGSTKELLESCFNYINRQISFSTTNKVASNPMKWALATLNPLAKPQFLPLPEDWFKAVCSPQGSALISHDLRKIFDITTTPVPECRNLARTRFEEDDPVEALSKVTILKALNFRAAGAEATQRSVAAAAYLCYERAHQFENVQNCWSGFFVYL